MRHHIAVWFDASYEIRSLKGVFNKKIEIKKSVNKKVETLKEFKGKKKIFFTLLFSLSISSPSCVLNLLPTLIKLSFPFCKE